MREQIDFTRSPEFESFVANLGTLEGAEAIIHGIFIELHPTWRAMYDDDKLRKAGIIGPFSFPGLFASDYHVGFPLGPYDLRKSPEFWSSHAAGKQPFLVKIYVQPTIEDGRYLRDRVEDYANRQPFFCLVIDAPVPTFVTQVNGAADLNVNQDGTLGGYLKDDSGPIYGVTCAHVAQGKGNAVTLKDVAGTRISNAGSVFETNFSSLVVVGPSGHCNPYHAQTASVNVDLALIELDSKFTPSNFIPNIGLVHDHIDKLQLNSHSTISHQGAMTGPNSYEIGGYGYMTKVNGGGMTYCFSDVFDFATNTSNRLQRGLAPLPVQGDSGSWLIHDDGITKYFFGMLIAVEKSRGIGVFATSILAHANDPNGWNLNLKVL